jgi:hypothetical protein
MHTICAERSAHHCIEFLSEDESALRVTLHGRMRGEAFGNAEQRDGGARRRCAAANPTTG